MGTRKSNDFYPTPKRAIKDILDRVKFEGQVWEPSCGDGAISKMLGEYGYSDVKSTDLYDQGYGIPGIDFLKTREKTDNILTNPPFNISTEYALHGLNVIRKKMVLLNKLTFLEGSKRRDSLFIQKKLEHVYIYSERLNFDGKTEEAKGGMVCFAWFVFNKEYNGDPTLSWI